MGTSSKCILIPTFRICITYCSKYQLINCIWNIFTDKAGIFLKVWVHYLGIKFSVYITFALGNMPDSVRKGITFKGIITIIGCSINNWSKIQNLLNQIFFISKHCKLSILLTRLIMSTFDSDCIISCIIIGWYVERKNFQNPEKFEYLITERTNERISYHLLRMDQSSQSNKKITRKI